MAYCCISFRYCFDRFPRILTDVHTKPLAVCERGYLPKALQPEEGAAHCPLLCEFYSLLWTIFNYFLHPRKLCRDWPVRVDLGEMGKLSNVP